MNIDLKNAEKFESRHIGPDAQQIQDMLKVVGADSLDTLIDQTIPKDIRLKKPLNLPQAKSESEFLRAFKKLIQQNTLFSNYIGMGYYNCHVPSVILRNVLENPGWYTAYTPYQAEIAQGRLEALINFQTTVMELTGMEIANASLLDEGTAAAEAMSMLIDLKKAGKKSAYRFFVDKNIFPQTLDVLKTRATPLGITLIIDEPETIDFEDEELYGILLQYPDGNGAIKNHSALIDKAQHHNIAVTVAADLLSLTLLTPPGELGADVVIGTTQRLGVPMGYGGPHAGYFATKEIYKRHIPGRIIGVSKDKDGNNAYRMALQTREQHIRREKATSNICTAQVLLAVMAGMYTVYHGPKGLQNIALRVHGLTQVLEAGLKHLGFNQENEYYFDTLKVTLPSVEAKENLRQLALENKINIRYFDTTAVGISLDETTRLSEVSALLSTFESVANGTLQNFDIDKQSEELALSWPEALIRKSSYLTHPVFNTHHSEHEMLRYIKQLENKDLSLTHSMIALGSCTMKLNATTEMMPLTWPELGNMHPFSPLDQSKGYQQMFDQLCEWLAEITGFAATSLQPNSGAQGEYAGLLVIRAYHQSRGDSHRNIALIPSSAHGTNPASAVMAGMKVVIVKCDDNGNIDIDDLRHKAVAHKEHLAAVMITYPSTHGVYEEGIVEMCEIIHENGGQVYMDGANMNAQVGLTSPGNIGADVCHLNLHKTFCIPHGGGGPGVGPICVAAHLAPFLPGNPVVQIGSDQAISAVSAAPWGSASICSISYAYIAMMGSDGLKQTSQLAILNANYIMHRLQAHYKVLYTGKNGRCAHEMIIDCREFKNTAGIEVEDIAKRLMDYGFHAPTVSFPVPGTMMIEPTESEAQEELDRFCDALISIREEIRAIEEGAADREINVLKNAPHTAAFALSDDWTMPYSRQQAVYPLPYVKGSKFWPSVRRVDSAYGDRNLMCSCIPVEEYEESM